MSTDNTPGGPTALPQVRQSSWLTADFSDDGG
jgi:hypothetical protein